MIRKLDNPPNPFRSQHVEYLADVPEAKVEVYEEQARSILSHNDSPDLPFDWSVNPYRGCQHACAYCYARPYHEYLDLGAGTDFDTKLFVKVNAPELLRRALSAPKWRGEPIEFSGVTDCYQPLEAVYEVTRQCLQVCLDFRNPAAIITRGYLIVRDAELLAALHREAGLSVMLSIAFADDATARLLEPHAPPPSRRFEAIGRLREAGVPVGVMLAPIIPGLNDRDIPRILQQAAECGAQTASCTALRLPGSVESVFLGRLRDVLPLQVGRIESRIREIRGGKLNETRPGKRMTGEGPYWEAIMQQFRIHCARHGLGRPSFPSANDPRRALAGKPPVAPRPTLLKSSGTRPEQQLSLSFEGKEEDSGS